MSSLVRRIQRQLYPSMAVHRGSRLSINGDWVPCLETRPARHKFYGKHLWSQGRGSKLGVTNPKCKSLLARLAREKRNAARKEDSNAPR